MRFGLGIDTGRPLPQVIEQVQRMADAGFVTAASSQIFGYDALTMLALVGQSVPGIGLATSVVPTYPRHPVMLAAQALTVQAATGGRLTLGIGLSHQIVVENVFGQSFDRPLRHMREYLSILLPVLRGEAASFQGEVLSGTTWGPLEIDAPAPPVVVAALGPRMLELAGTVADGTATWMTGPATLRDHVVPTITAAAEAAGRPSPRVVVSLPVCVTDDVDAARATADGTFAVYGTLPSYRAMLDREHAAGPGDVAIVGNELAVTEQIASLDVAGATEFVGSIYGDPDERDRTFSLLATLAKEAR
jgi:5,10-methylenetetrahydromethanopterin reductase